jgi:hypothetical protein
MKTKYYTVVKKNSGDLSHCFGGKALLTMFSTKKDAQEELEAIDSEESQFKVMKVTLENI